MSTSVIKLSQCISVGRRFLRSVNLERDFAGGEHGGGYIVTPSARELLHRISEGLDASPTFSTGATFQRFYVG